MQFYRFHSGAEGNHYECSLGNGLTETEVLVLLSSKYGVRPVSLTIKSSITQIRSLKRESKIIWHSGISFAALLSHLHKVKASQHNRNAGQFKHVEAMQSRHSTQ
jgi:hypothetical protein